MRFFKSVSISSVHPTVLFISLVIFAFVLSACGSGGSSASETSSSQELESSLSFDVNTEAPLELLSLDVSSGYLGTDACHVYGVLRNNSNSICNFDLWFSVLDATGLVIGEGVAGASDVHGGATASYDTGITDFRITSILTDCGDIDKLELEQEVYCD